MCETVVLRTDNSVSIHGDKDQRERDLALSLFKSGAKRVLVATDVAARGLDVKSVRLVVNFDPPNREEDYVHRVGRTGRAGLKGTAVTLLTNEDGAAAKSIVDILKRMDLPVPEELERRMSSGEMQQSRGRGMGGGGRDGGGMRSRSMGPGVGRSSGRSFMDDDNDFGEVAGGRGGFGGARRDSDRGFGNSFECPTW